MKNYQRLVFFVNLGVENQNSDESKKVFSKKKIILILTYFVIARDTHIEYSTLIMVEHTFG